LALERLDSSDVNHIGDEEVDGVQRREKLKNELKEMKVQFKERNGMKRVKRLMNV